jgi:AbrB family looped-hinge helix DNA binding protein
MMTIAVSTQGRITIPVKLRREMEIEKGTVFEINASEGQILLKISKRAVMPQTRSKKEADLLSFNE